MFDEQKELSERYVKFNVQELMKAAINVCEGATNCGITKCAEGFSNKGFILTMDNGSEVFAKIPNLIAGPARLTIASEVVTRELLRDVFKIPVPRVLAWSSDPNNPVEAEYIIEERATGRKLQSIDQVVDMENRLTGITFDSHGCIYFMEDLRTLIDETGVDIAPLGPGSLKHFSLGPLTSRELWEGARRDMKLDRGPLAPYLVPGSTDRLASANVLWHPDLHLENIFVDSVTGKITGIVDWQLACVTPMFYQSDVPRLCQHFGTVWEG
ncbi:uncharacterized protein ASPGLDRAFT_65230 [Aspergillus glaucus CBS 516.65]|uniref:Altered inheritance of mitochondria protein 9, mitochondrial n=1 Tax=Aspergillus glaucus CBS 516.65 TaxID=1160497 RepID=A0A1L9VQ76_ASPGL|nr:hypothetical protein ASPGLDRAFT_65230 [Aspergillus glaucus CBS 516.65]OJJ86067.1 hypothetical protein ASPGLDRAFT_65230 [Aspergillus glaucus CBS 516.65]